MTRSAAISIAILALVALALIMLLGRHGSHAASMPTGDEIDPRADQRRISGAYHAAWPAR
jgi:hypothetical protein